jgi:pimeloyl-ACP methyl ester carboxylesterase
VGAITSIDGTRIAYSKTGSGPALILVDPALGFRGFGPMGDMVDHLATDFTVYTYDRRGRGESSDTLPYAVAREVEDLEALIEAAGGSAFVYGFSSGAVLGLYTAQKGNVKKLALLEPPLSFDDQSSTEPDLGAEIRDLVAAGRRGDAVEHFNRSIGVPEEMIDGLRRAPFWPQLEAMAHTMAYDTTITGSFPVNILPAITTPTLVVTSQDSDDRLHNWAERAAADMPAGEYRTLPGEWHGVAADVLAPVLVEFFKSGKRS